MSLDKTKHELSPAAKRALAEAKLRRDAADHNTPEQAVIDPRPVEINGPKGPEPTRYGDWERKGIVSDF